MSDEVTLADVEAARGRIRELVRITRAVADAGATSSRSITRP